MSEPAQDSQKLEGEKVTCPLCGANTEPFPGMELYACTNPGCYHHEQFPITVQQREKGMREKLSRRAADVIDGPWLYSMHWKRDEFENVTLEGYRKILKDFEGKVYWHEERANRLRELIPEIKAEIQKREAEEGDDGC